MNNTSKEKNQNLNQNQNEDQQNQFQGLSKLKKILGQEVPSDELNAQELDTCEMLQEIYRNTTAGMYSVETIKPYVKDKELRKLLFNQFNAYKKLSKEIELEAANQELDIKPINIMAKFMMTSGTFFNTLGDKSSSKIAEIMLQGIDMGIISCIKLINGIGQDNTNIDLSLAKKTLELFQNNFEQLKAYL